MALQHFLLDHVQVVLNRTVLAAVIACSVTTYAAYRFLIYRRLRHIPGPRWTGLTEIPHIRAMLTEHCYEWYHSVSKTYGQCIHIHDDRQSLQL
jgi:hypothetical protein